MQAVNLKKNPNYVHIAERWKDHVRHEHRAWRNWPERWGFITNEYTRMYKRLRGEQVSPDPEDKYFYDDCERDGERESSVGPDESISRRFHPSDQSVSPSHSGAKLKHASAYSDLPNIINGSSWKERQSPNSTSIETVVNVTDIDVAHKAKSEKLPTIKTAPPAGYARTTASLIGWKQANKLETFGRNAKGYKGILKQFNWPMQGIM
ncbi:uncharacterized protein LOC105441157 [Strongylocentrotus purpuratus]|uniref:Uncharacterized protein n=1 Tax=Strongylocentrotus purpuratus TaxID=7668 RepID=A0A7M7HL88_STRPU|nr:uncharacterized protein LOC105441157 [Strongylocentrotus purpuratus]8SNB_1f Chain 1f, C20Orf85 [Strongylocentrotus purpuratus]8SNB_1g Chain 1g, C20Orf85 [Strongylocentrotus purpuratus]